MEQVIVIVGPTCSGKTQLSLELAERLKTEIISADSRQIYKYLDIGTAKPSGVHFKNIRHHFISTLEPDEKFNVIDFETEALKIIRKIHSQNKVPIVAGGSGLYIKALIDGIFNSVDTDEEYRTKLLEERKEFGDIHLYMELKKIDPVSVSNMLPQNYKRVIRALEVYHLTGKPIWKFQQEYKRDIGFKFLQFGLQWERKVLYNNIGKRVDAMIESGLVDEVKNILKKGYAKNINALNTFGYKEIISFLEGGVSLEIAIDLIKRNTRRFAKRQLTWFNKDKRINWIPVSNSDDLIKASSQIINRLNQ